MEATSPTRADQDDEEYQLLPQANESDKVLETKEGGEPSSLIGLKLSSSHVQESQGTAPAAFKESPSSPALGHWLSHGVIRLKAAVYLCCAFAFALHVT